VNLPLLRYTFASNLLRLLVIAAGMVLMGVIMPVMYAAFGVEMTEFIESIPFFARIASSFGGGDVFSLNGSLAMAFTHPFTLLLVGIMAIGFPALAISGERDKGTLEVTLSRPISRRGLLATLLLAGVVFIFAPLAVLALTTGITSYLVGFGQEVEYAHLAQLWLASGLLFTAFAALAFAVAVESDRAGPAIGVPAVFILLNYLAWAIGSIWPDVGFFEDWSMFSLLESQKVLAEGAAAGDFIVMLAFIAFFVGVAWYRFPRRDLPAPA
jgi:ABC-2 type transport system permease protein